MSTENEIWIMEPQADSPLCETCFWPVLSPNHIHGCGMGDGLPMFIYDGPMLPQEEDEIRDCATEPLPSEEEEHLNTCWGHYWAEQDPPFPPHKRLKLMSS